MIFLMLFSICAASIFSLAAFLQSEAAWWKGFLAAAMLFLAGFGIAMGISEELLENTILPPVAGLVWAAWVGAAVIGLGSILALVLRKFLSPGRIAGAAFLCGFPVFSVLPFLI
ncbi:hypothetical protein [Leisingera sp. JC1]|uniref:hypothetical protein n=1 Tax=Leisingera sp. JC1 TaxID=1855282 RepID=UPI000802F740|nr:hypothetical protein [Leisingera sp. JC1]OBY24537.1 hypothetical protein A9D60_09355 [Leisingera sp. JC1]